MAGNFNFLTFKWLENALKSQKIESKNFYLISPQKNSPQCSYHHAPGRVKLLTPQIVFFFRKSPQQNGGLGYYVSLITNAEFTDKNVISNVVLFCTVPKCDVIIYTNQKNRITRGIIIMMDWNFYPFSAWYPLIGHRYLNKPAAFRLF